MDKLVACLLALVFVAFIGAAFLDGAHKRMAQHACQMAAIDARYPAPDAAIICNLK